MNNKRMKKQTLPPKCIKFFPLVRNEDKEHTLPLLFVVCSAGDRTNLLVFQNSKLGELIHKCDNTLLLLTQQSL